MGTLDSPALLGLNQLARVTSEARANTRTEDTENFIAPGSRI